LPARRATGSLRGRNSYSPRRHRDTELKNLLCDSVSLWWILGLCGTAVLGCAFFLAYNRAYEVRCAAFFYSPWSCGFGATSKFQNRSAVGDARRRFGHAALATSRLHCTKPSAAGRKRAKSERSLPMLRESSHFRGFERVFITYSLRIRVFALRIFAAYWLRWTRSLRCELGW
jgi:hypothetical protein